jgi:hypothetical protein
LALHALGGDAELVVGGCKALADAQHPDGRVCRIAERPETCWPTPLAILAWRTAGGFEAALRRGVDFLLRHSGQHWDKTPDSVFGHDPSIPGWPWIADTHSWVEPTSMAILALAACGQADHPRVAEGRRMLLDRQLAAGGWNYGNTTVFGAALLPAPESTGHALCALAGRVASAEVAASMSYLEEAIAGIRTPLALTWGLFGLRAWSRGGGEVGPWLVECLERQERYGAFGVDLLAQALLAWATQGDLRSYLHV